MSSGVPVCDELAGSLSSGGLVCDDFTGRVVLLVCDELAGAGSRVPGVAHWYPRH